MRAVASILLCLTILGSSIHLRIDTHVCMGRVVGFSFFGEAEQCAHHEEADHSSNHCHKQNHQHLSLIQKKKGCCEDKEYLVEGLSLEALLHKNVAKEYAPENWISLHFTEITNSFQVADYILPHYLNYKPPLIQVDIPIHLQTFLI